MATWPQRETDPMDQPNASPLSSEQTDMANDLAARLVERLRLQGQGKRAEAVPLPPLPSHLALSEEEKAKAAAKGWPAPPPVTSGGIKAQGRGPDTAPTVEREANEEGATLSSPPPSEQAKRISEEMTTRAMAEGSEGKRVDPTPERIGLPTAAKNRIVEMFATFQPLSAVMAMLRDEFDLVPDQRTVLSYNCDRPQARVGKRLRHLFTETRAAYVEKTASVAISHQAHRLRLLTTIVEKAEKSKDFNAALKGLELAAKEMGGMLDASVAKKVEHSGMVAHAHLNVEDARQEVAMRLRQMVEAAPSPAPSLPAPQGIEDGEFSAIPEEDTGQGQ